MSRIAVLRSRSPISAPLSHPATRAVREAEALLDTADACLQLPNPARDPSLADGLLVTAEVPQYDRAFVQGCACATGLAGGGCCPGGAAGATVQGMGGMRPAPFMAVFRALSGFVGVYMGLAIGRRSQAALAQLEGVRRHLADAAHAVAITLARVARHNEELGAARRDAPELAARRGLLLQTQEALVSRQHQLRGALRDVEASADEQRFNRLVPGGMQAGAAAATVVAAAAHCGVGVMGCGGGAVAAGAFAAYGGTLAIKHALTWRRDAGAPALPAAAPVSRAYRAAYDRHRMARRVDARATASAWAGVAAAS
jgi:hypothetical protein